MAGLEECVKEFVNREAKIVVTVFINRIHPATCSIKFDQPAQHPEGLMRLWRDALEQKFGKSWIDDTKNTMKIDDVKTNKKITLTLYETTGTLLVQGTDAVNWAEERIRQVIQNYRADGEDQRDEMGATGGEKVMPTNAEEPGDGNVDTLAREPQKTLIGVQTEEPTASTGPCHGDGVDDLGDEVARMSLKTSTVDNVTVTQYSDGTIDVLVKNIPIDGSRRDVGPSERNEGEASPQTADD